VAEPAFDPRGILATLDRHHVLYIVVGGFARVIQGADEVTLGVDIVPSRREDNLRRLDAALEELGARQAGKRAPALAGAGELDDVIELKTKMGELKVVPHPAGTDGYEDLRRARTHEHIGQGLRPAVASVGDLSRMLAALGREDDMPKLMDLRLLTELEVGHGIEI
jgi:hypothetical protein